MIRVRIEESQFEDSYSARIISKSHRRHGERLYIPKHAISKYARKRLERDTYAYCLVQEHHF